MGRSNLMANPRQENILFNIANSKASKQIVATSCCSVARLVLNPNSSKIYLNLILNKLCGVYPEYFHQTFR